MRTLTVPHLPGVVNGCGDMWCICAGEPGHRAGRGGTVGPVATVLLSAIVLVAVMFLVVVAALALAARAYSRRQLDDARAQARHWVERLGAELLVLDAAAVRRRAVDPAGLGEAAERFTAANAELAAARSRRQCRIAQDTAVEGLHHVRAARRSLGLDPGPRVPGQGVVDTIRAALADGTWSMPRLAEAVLADAGERARPLPPVLPCRPTGSARSSSNGCVPGPFGADRYVWDHTSWAGPRRARIRL